MNDVTVMLLFTSSSLIIIYFINFSLKRKFFLNLITKDSFIERPSPERKYHKRHLYTNSGQNSFNQWTCHFTLISYDFLTVVAGSCFVLDLVVSVDRRQGGGPANTWIIYCSSPSEPGQAKFLFHYFLSHLTRRYDRAVPSTDWRLERRPEQRQRCSRFCNYLPSQSITQSRSLSSCPPHSATQHTRQRESKSEAFSLVQVHRYTSL